MYLPSSPQSHPRSQLSLADNFQFKGSTLSLPTRLPHEYTGAKPTLASIHRTAPLSYRNKLTSNLATVSHSGCTSALLTTPTRAITPNTPASPHPRQRNPRNSRYCKLFLPLLIILQILLLALPLTILLFVQAAAAQHPIAPTLIALVFLLGFTIAVATVVIVLCIIRRHRHKSQKRLLETEVERWKTLAREKLREARAASVTSERLRTTVRSLSRGRASVKSQERRAETQISDGRRLSEKLPRSKSVEGGDAQNGAERSVSRVRTGKKNAGNENKEEDLRDIKIEDDMGEEMWEGSKRVGEEVWELDGQPILVNRGPSNPKVQGSLLRAREAAQALQTLTTSSIGQRVKKMIDGHTWVKPTTLSIREVYRNKPLPPTPPRSPMLPRIISPDWGASQALSTSPQQISQLGPLLLPSLHLPDVSLSPLASPWTSPLHLWNDSQTFSSSPRRLAALTIDPVAPLQQPQDDELPPLEIAVMDHYVAWTDMRERSRSKVARTERQELVMDHHAALREIHDSSHAGTSCSGTRGRGFPISKTDAERSTGNIDSYQDQMLQLENSSHSSQSEDDECSLPSRDSYDSSGLPIMRHGNGLLGSSQSDENFDHNHALEEDAMSLTSSQRELKKALSIRKIGKWANESAVVVAEPSSVVAAYDGVECPGGGDFGIDGRVKDRSDESSDHTVKRMSIRQARQAFGQWVLNKGQRTRSVSRGRTHARGRV